MELNQSVLLYILLAKKPPFSLPLFPPENVENLLPYLPSEACNLLSAIDAYRTYSSRLSRYQAKQLESPSNGILSLISPQDQQKLSVLKTYCHCLSSGDFTPILRDILPRNYSSLLSNLSSFRALGDILSAENEE